MGHGSPAAALTARRVDGSLAAMSDEILTGALIDLESKLDDESIVQLLALSVGLPTPAKLAAVCREYRRHEDYRLLGYAEGAGILGCIGLALSRPGQGAVRHIAVAPDQRNRGVGRWMLKAAAQRLSLTRIEAETDNDAVGFYRSCGFQCESMGEPHPGIERCRCIWTESR